LLSHASFPPSILADAPTLADKPGLVEHYASLLISSNIRSLMYQSTFGSASILVAKRDVELAKEVLARG
jgi:hypothetical protein